MLSDADIQAMKNRVSRATPGPWSVRNHYGYKTCVEAAGGQHCVATVSEPPLREEVAAFVADEQGTKPVDLAVVPNAAFIAAARSDIPVLLAEVERLRVEVAFEGSARDLVGRLDVRLAAAERENAALREIAQRMVDYLPEYNDNATLYECQFCDAWGTKDAVMHRDTCPVTQARALLANK